MQSKRLAVFDIDRTLSKEFLAIPIMQAEEKSGLLASGTSDHVMHLLVSLKNGSIKYETAAHRILVAHAHGLKKQSVHTLYTHTQTYLQQHAELFRAFGDRVMKLLHPTHQLVAVTAEPAYMAQAVADLLGMDNVLSSEYGMQTGQFTGRLTRSLAHRSEKRQLIGALRPDFAFGDSAGDIEMLLHAHHAYCISPDAELTATAHEHSWEVFNGDTDTDQLIRSIEKHL